MKKAYKFEYSTHEKTLIEMIGLSGAYSIARLMQERGVATALVVMPCARSTREYQDGGLSAMLQLCAMPNQQHLAFVSILGIKTRMLNRKAQQASCEFQCIEHLAVELLKDLTEVLRQRENDTFQFSQLPPKRLIDESKLVSFPDTTGRYQHDISEHLEIRARLALQ